VKFAFGFAIIVLFLSTTLLFVYDWESISTLPERIIIATEIIITDDDNDNDVVVDDDSSEDPGEKILPSVLYLIFGLESSGTTFVAQTISTAVGIGDGIGQYEYKKKNRDVWEDFSHTSIFIQHISLPMGAFNRIQLHNKTGTEKKEMQKNLNIVDVYLPTACRKQNNRINIVKRICIDDTLVLPNGIKNKNKNNSTNTNIFRHSRYFVNITNHIRWYQNRGVTVKPIVVVRDQLFQYQGALQKHCQYVEACNEQFEMGHTIIKEAIRNNNYNNNGGGVQATTLSSSSPILIVSYETLMNLQETYLIEYVYRNLHINSTYVPKFIDGNTEHAHSMINRHISPSKLLRRGSNNNVYSKAGSTATPSARTKRDSPIIDYPTPNNSPDDKSKTREQYKHYMNVKKKSTTTTAHIRW